MKVVPVILDHKMTHLRPFNPLDLSLSVDVPPPPPFGRLLMLTLAASCMASCTPRLCLAEHSTSDPSVLTRQSASAVSDLDIFQL